MIKEGPSRT